MTTGDADPRGEAVSAAMRCCGEHGCRRGQPIRVLRSGLTGSWYVVTRWSEKEDGTIVAEQKHAVHPADADQLELAHQRAVKRTP